MQNYGDTPILKWSPHWLVRWIGIPIALVALGWATWYFGIKQPDDREAAALAKERAAKSFTIPGLNLDMVWIAPGSFLMGTPEQNALAKLFYAAREKLTKQPNLSVGENNERPVTWVTLTEPFWLGRTAVTQGQFERLMGTDPSQFTAAGHDAPVENVSWDYAMAFCQKLTEQERAAGHLPNGYVYTLPTEAQREYACRAGITGAFAGDLDAIVWYEKNSGDSTHLMATKTPNAGAGLGDLLVSGTTHQVGTKAPNAWDLYDMEGNVMEWCRDWYAEKLPGGEVTNPRGPSSGSFRVVRGGSFISDELACRSAFRHSFLPYESMYYIGFRLALTPSS